MALEKLTITKVNYTDKKADGSPILSKFGKQSWRVGILTNEYGNTWLNGFLPFCPDKWEGTTQTVEVYDEEYNGKEQKKFKLPPREEKVPEKVVMQITALELAVSHIRTVLENKGIMEPAKKVVQGTSVEYPKDTFNPENITFDGVDAETASLEEAAAAAMS
ncbi:hypothetical protein C4568_03675 [Candidatus Parcubacteria bacterium]|nr:MAG: hypothetical protein C4568_03675 [Candidatus Parcubacteria bacterium]